MGIQKNAGFGADFESVGKVPKKLQRKKIVSEKIQFLTFVTVCNSFRLFLDELFCIFSTDSNSASNFAFSDTHCDLFWQTKYFQLILALFANFRPQRGRNGSKKQKTYFLNMSQSPIYIHFWLGGSILSKRVKIVVS